MCDSQQGFAAVVALKVLTLTLTKPKMIGYWVVVTLPRKTTTVTRDGITNRSPTFVPGELATLRISLLLKGREHFTLGPIDKNGVPHVYPYRYAKPDNKRLWEERSVGIHRQVHNNDATSGMIASFKHLLKVNRQPASTESST